MARFVARRAQAREARVEAFRTRANQALPELVGLLVARGAQRVWLFGSLVWGEAHERSDIDLAVEGLPGEDLWRAQGALLATAPCGVNLARIEEVPPTLCSRIRTAGRLLHG
jgi:predicted nucleotidyltransferase